MLNTIPSVPRWEDRASVLLGIAAAVAAAVLHPTIDAIAINGVIAGLVIVALAVLELGISPRDFGSRRALAGS